MNVYAYYKTLRKPYFDFLDRHPKFKIVHLTATLFLTGWTFKNSTQEVLKIIQKFLEKKIKINFIYSVYILSNIFIYFRISSYTVVYTTYILSYISYILQYIQIFSSIYTPYIKLRYG